MAASPRQRTRERILDGAMVAVARLGLAKLDMSDVSESAGVSRGTVYRYFSNRDDLLTALSVQEAYRFWEACLTALSAAPEGEQRFRLLVDHANRHVREHPALQRILETDPALVLRAVRREFPAIRAELHRLLAPLLEAMAPVAQGAGAEAQRAGAEAQRAGAEAQRAGGVDDVVDWLTRLLISAFLIPDPDPDAMPRGLTAVYRLMATQRP
jgi:AcrR family transcriptional regulator